MTTLSESEFIAAKNLVITCIHCHYYDMRSDKYVYASCCSKCKLRNNSTGIYVPELKEPGYKFEPSERWYNALKQVMKLHEH